MQIIIYGCRLSQSFWINPDLTSLPHLFFAGGGQDLTRQSWVDKDCVLLSLFHCHQPGQGKLRQTDRQSDRQVTLDRMAKLSLDEPRLAYIAVPTKVSMDRQAKVSIDRKKQGKLRHTDQHKLYRSRVV